MTTPQEQFRSQFSRPGDVMSVLLLLGGDVIQRALAQLSGTPLTPVAFSFGWVSYAVTALLTAVGENRLLPAPDSAGIVVNASNGYARQNMSWVVGRMIRDYSYWRDRRVREAEITFLEQEEQEEKGDGERPPEIKLSLAVYDAVSTSGRRPGKAVHDWVYYTGVLCWIVQLGLATVPWGVWGNWSIFLTTACGIILAIASGALPQWKAEKLSCRCQTRKTVCLTAGNGARDAFVVIGNGVGLDLEDLAGGRTAGRRETRALTSLLAVMWVVMLIAVSGLKEHSWFLLAIGVIGMVQNVVVCAAPRRPEAFGIHLEFKEVVTGKKVMEVLKLAEEKYPRVGRCLVDVFFPGNNLRPDEVEYWQKAEEKAKASGR